MRRKMRRMASPHISETQPKSGEILTWLSSENVEDPNIAYSAVDPWLIVLMTFLHLTMLRSRNSECQRWRFHCERLPCLGVLVNGVQCWQVECGHHDWHCSSTPVLSLSIISIKSLIYPQNVEIFHSIAKQKW